MAFGCNGHLFMVMETKEEEKVSGHIFANMKEGTMDNKPDQNGHSIDMQATRDRCPMPKGMCIFILHKEDQIDGMRGNGKINPKGNCRSIGNLIDLISQRFPISSIGPKCNNKRVKRRRRSPEKCLNTLRGT